MNVSPTAPSSFFKVKRRYEKASEANNTRQPNKQFVAGHLFTAKFWVQNPK